MVWLEEINSKLVISLGSITVKDENGVPKAIEASYSKPEGEGQEDIDDLLPMASVRLYDLRLDLDRIGTNHGIKNKVAETDTTITLKDYPLPYYLFYEFTLMAEFQEDIMAMVTQIQQLFPPRGILYVLDSEDSVEVALYMELVEALNPARVEPSKPLFEQEVKTRRIRAVFRYRLTAELDSAQAQVVGKVLKTDIQSIPK